MKSKEVISKAPSKSEEIEQPSKGLSLVEYFNQHGWPSPQETIETFRSVGYKLRFRNNNRRKP